MKPSGRPLESNIYLKKKQKQVRDKSPCLIFRMIFEVKYFSCYILLTAQISLFGCV